MQISLNIKNESISQRVLEFLSSFAGMWKDRDITIESLREAA
ncbi:hypothetical protein [Sulfurimonas sp.]|nr:hypothetical protein [Sulfurimonas sp.]